MYDNSNDKKQLPIIAYKTEENLSRMNAIAWDSLYSTFRHATKKACNKKESKKKIVKSFILFALNCLVKRLSAEIDNNNNTEKLNNKQSGVIFKCSRFVGG